MNKPVETTKLTKKPTKLMQTHRERQGCVCECVFGQLVVSWCRQGTGPW